MYLHTVITPKNAVIKEGTRFQIICNLKKLRVTFNDSNKSVPVNSSNIIFTHESESIQSIKIINETSAQIEIQESHLNDSGKYFCHLQVGDHHQLQLGFMELIVGRE